MYEVENNKIRFCSFFFSSFFFYQREMACFLCYIKVNLSRRPKLDILWNRHRLPVWYILSGLNSWLARLLLLQTKESGTSPPPPPPTLWFSALLKSWCKPHLMSLMRSSNCICTLGKKPLHRHRLFLCVSLSLSFTLMCVCEQMKLCSKFIPPHPLSFYVSHSLYSAESSLGVFFCTNNILFARREKTSAFI